jgi:hypothetical protein
MERVGSFPGNTRADDGFDDLASGAAICKREVCVLRTSTDETRLAIQIASDLAHAMAARLTLIDLRPVRNPDPPSIPGGEADWTTAFVERLRSQGLDIGVRFYVCGDERQAIPFAFRPNSLIVIGGKRSWLPTRTECLRRTLEAAGHLVLSVDGSTHHDQRFS